jgi:RNA polymerase sigma-70 factor (ECF subfamily)
VTDIIDDEGPLIDAARAGDRVALDRLLRRHQPQIHAVCRRITGNDADALDATQDALIAIVRGLPAFDGRARFATWAYRVATNACLDELRRRKRRPVPVDTDLHQSGDDHGSDGRLLTGGPPVDQVADGVADRLLVDHALAELAPEFRVAVVLRDLCQLDYAEIADVLDIPIGTVRSRIARGRRHLADVIGHSTGGNSTGSADRPTTAP